MFEKIPYSEYKVRFIDCDPLGHLTNSRYIDYMLNAREDHVNFAYGLDYMEIAQKTGCSWVTLQNQISYLKEVKYNQEIKITSKLIEYSKRRCKVEIQLLDAFSEKLHTFLWTEVIFFNIKERKAAEHPQEIMDLFHQVCVDIPEKKFEERVKFYLQKK